VPYKDEKAVLRGRADLVYEVDGVRYILDWKSGRVYPDHPEQGLTYVALDTTGAHRYRTEFVYLDMPTTTIPRDYTMYDRQQKMNELEVIMTTINNDTTYTPTPSTVACKYCPRSWRTGGDCKRAM